MTTITLRLLETPDEFHLPNVRCVVTTNNESWPGLAERCAEHGLALLTLLYDQPLEPESEGVWQGPAGGHILQTSGTTGDYKMVLYDSATEEAVLRWSTDGDADTMFNLLAYPTWTVAGYIIPLGVWWLGGGLIIHQKRAPHEALRDLRSTHVIMLPHYLKQVLAAPEGSFPRNDKLLFYISGGTVTRSEVAEAQRRISPHIVNRIGSTEAGSIASTPLLEPDDHRWHIIQAGRTVEIVDEDDRPVPVGQTGRLRIATAGGPAAYFNNREATMAFFRDGYFYPGDLAVAREDGRIALQGRVTDVINVNGRKMSPVLIEDIVREEFNLSDVCIFSAQDEYGEEQFYAVVESDRLPAAEVRASIERRFGDLMLNVRHLPSLPRTPTGKVIRNQVREQVLVKESGR
jgi:acyl-CoA synthetase (AMP-forming)/AMP-acid ligase II